MTKPKKATSALAALAQLVVAAHQGQAKHEDPDMTTKQKMEQGPASAQEARLRRMGYLRISDAARKIGRSVTFLHRAIKDPMGGFHGPRLSPNTAPPEWLRAGYLYYIYEPALRKLVGEQVARMVGLRTEAQVRQGQRPTG